MKRFLILLLLLATPTFGQSPGQRTDFQPLAPVRVLRANGTELPKGLGASSAATLGAAVVSAQSAATTGETIAIDAPGTYTVTAGTFLNKNLNYNLAAGVTLNKASNRLLYDNAGALTGKIGGNGSITSTALFG